MKKIFSLIIALLLLLSAFSVSAQPHYATRGEVCTMLLTAADFYNSDVKKEDILKGYEDGLLHEERAVTRAEALVMLSRAFKSLPELKGHNKRVALSADDFSDIPTWAQKELAPIFDRGIVGGTAKGVFSPNQNVTVEQMELFIKRVYALYGENLKDDFYASVNKEMLENTAISQGEYTAGTVTTLQKKAKSDVQKIIENILKKGAYEDSAEEKIASFYESAVDVKTRNKDGISPISKYIDAINNARNTGELARVQIMMAQELCQGAYMEFSLNENPQNSSEYSVSFYSFRPNMNKEFYFENTSDKTAYIDYVATLLNLCGEDEAIAKTNAERYFEFEKKIAEKMLSVAEENDVTNVFNEQSFNRLSLLFPDFNMESVINASGLTREDKVIVYDKGATEEFARLFVQSNLNELKTVAKLSLVNAYGKCLNKEFTSADEAFKQKLLGTSGSFSASQRALNSTEEVMGEYIGILYAKEHFDEESKSDVEKMALDIIEVFKESIESVSWMSDEAKDKAKTKLDAMNIKIGYPDAGKSFLDDAQIKSPKDGGTYFENMLSVNSALKKYISSLQGKSAGRDSWAIYPHTVNACYSPQTNDITFPAAILQAPLYDKNNSYEENLGGIGYVIAHEITHAFDKNGSLFDENGNLCQWWEKEDYVAFDTICDKVINYYNAKEAISAVPMNGTLTLDENIADIGGGECITKLAQKKGANLTAVYVAMAKSFASTKTREGAKFLAQTDVHSDDKLRVNCVLSSMDAFYSALGIVEGDGMFVPENERIRIWSEVK